MSYTLPRSDEEMAMKRFMVGEARDQSTLFPALLDDFIADDNPVLAFDALVEELDLKDIGL